MYDQVYDQVVQKNTNKIDFPTTILIVWLDLCERLSSIDKDLSEFITLKDNTQ